MLCECVNITKILSLRIKLPTICATKLTELFGEIKNVTNSKVKLPSRIGDVHGSDAVAGMWKEHYSSIFF